MCSNLRKFCQLYSTMLYRMYALAPQPHSGATCAAAPIPFYFISSVNCTAQVQHHAVWDVCPGYLAAQRHYLRSGANSICTVVCRRMDSGTINAVCFALARYHPRAPIFLNFRAASNNRSWSYKNLSTQNCGKLYAVMAQDEAPVLLSHPCLMCTF